MPNTVSTVLRDAIYRGRTERVFITLITINHSDDAPAGERLSSPLRFTNDSVRTRSGGNTYTPLPFRIRLPDNREGAQPSASLELPNTDIRLVQAFRTLQHRPKFEIRVVLDDNPSRIERGPYEMELGRVSYPPGVIRVDIVAPSLLSEPFPKDTYHTMHYPGVA